MAKQIGYRIVGTITAVKGECGMGHAVGDTMEISAYEPGGLCGFFYHGIFPAVQMLQFGGSFPLDWGDPDVVEQDCADKWNCVTIELRRIRE